MIRINILNLFFLAMLFISACNNGGASSETGTVTPPPPGPEVVISKYSDALKKGDTNKALSYVTNSEKQKYSDFFNLIGQNGLLIYADSLNGFSFKENIGQLAVYSNTLDVDGAPMEFELILLKNPDGTWTILSD